MRTWNASLALGVPDIDAQHRQLFRRADSLLLAMHQRRSAEEVVRLLGFLDEYCAHHFASEERLMHAHRYPGLEEHRAQHAGFAARFRELADRFHAGGHSPVITIGLQRLVCGWLVEHIGETDAKLARHLRAAAPAS